MTDQPTRERLVWARRLSPTPSELWKPLTKPGIFQHPDDVSVGCPGKDTA